MALHESIDLHNLITLMCGKLDSTDKSPYDEIELISHGKNPFNDLISFLSQHPNVKQSDSVTFHPSLSLNIFDKIKSGIASTIRGDQFNNVGATMFEVVDNLSSELSGDAFVKELSVVKC
mgnify:CR=1 FL=1